MPQRDWHKSEDFGLKRSGGRRWNLRVTCAHFTEQCAFISGFVVQPTVSGKGASAFSKMLSYSDYKEVQTVTQGLPGFPSPVYKINIHMYLSNSDFQ